MRHLKLVFKIYILIFFSTAQATYFNRYLDTIIEQCSHANTLMIKKSLISLLKDVEKKCDDSFSQRLLSECPSLKSCNHLHDILNASRNSNSGNVIGVKD